MKSLDRASPPVALKLLNEAPLFRPVALKLMQLSQGDASIGAIALLVESDPALALRVLTLANSALFVTRVKLNSVRNAIAFIGLERLKALAATVCLFDSFRTTGSNRLRPAWRHSLATALVCERTSSATSMGGVDEAYTAGLLHDIGRLALIQTHPGQYEDVLAYAGEQAIGVCESEKRTFGIDHCEAGEWLLARSKMTLMLQMVAARHHDAAAGELNLPYLVRIASVVADVIGFACTPIDAHASENELSNMQGIAAVQDMPTTMEQVAVKINEIECYLL